MERNTERAEVPITHLTCRRLHDCSDLLNELMQAGIGQPARYAPKHQDT